MEVVGESASFTRGHLDAREVAVGIDAEHRFAASGIHDLLDLAPARIDEVGARAGLIVHPLQSLSVG